MTFHSPSAQEQATLAAVQKFNAAVSRRDVGAIWNFIVADAYTGLVAGAQWGQRVRAVLGAVPGAVVLGSQAQRESGCHKGGRAK